MAARSDAELCEFVYQEARLLDEKRFDEWYALLADDARYWMPLTRGQTDARTHTSLFYEDKLLLRVRIERLRSPTAFSQHQPSFCQHILQQPQVESRDEIAHRHVLRTPFLYVESRLDEQLVLAGTAWHHLTEREEGMRIALKKIELVNCDAALPSIQLLL